MKRKSLWIVLGTSLCVLALGFGLRKTLWENKPAGTPTPTPAAEPEAVSTFGSETTETVTVDDGTDPLSCQGILKSGEPVSQDQLYSVTIKEGSRPEWNLSLDVQPDQKFDLTQTGRNGDLPIAACTSEGRRILCSEVFVSPDASGSPWACVDLKLTDGSQKHVKFMVTVESAAVKLPDNLGNFASKDRLPILGYIQGATKDAMEIWESSAPEARPSMI